MAWKVSGYIDADYLLLSRSGTPWRGVPVAAGLLSSELKHRAVSAHVGGPAAVGKQATIITERFAGLRGFWQPCFVVLLRYELFL